ncbi:MAG: DUF4012 domain-containing protein [Microbacterium sp.]
MSAGGETRRGRRIAIIVIVAVIAILGVAAGWLIFRGLQAKADLDAAVTASRQLSSAVAQGDLDAAALAADDVARHTAAAESATGDVVWSAAELVPWVGANLTAVRVAATEAHAVAVDVAMPIVELARTITASTDGDALIDLDALAAGATSLTKADATLSHAAQALASLDPAGLIEPVANGVEQLTDAVYTARPAVSAALDASRIVPGILGADAPRTILVIVQNTAELRTGGGITGTFIEFRADRGALEIVAQADSSQFARRKSSLLPVPTATTELYGDVVGRYVQDMSLTPDFDLTARLASAWWDDLTGRTVDTVVSIDPLVLQAVLKITGPVEVADRTIDADNMIDALLVEPYMTLSQAEQTSMFEATATKVFRMLTNGDVDAVSLARTLAPPIEEGRVSAWSAHADEAEILSRSSFAGPAARQEAAGRDAYAVYLNDVTGGKMDSFLEVAISSGTASCRADGTPTVEVEVTLTSTAPKSARSFPMLMTGDGNFGVAPGHIGTTVSVSAPANTFFAGVRLDDSPVAAVDRTDGGFQVSAYTVDLAPGETKTIAFRFDVDALTPLTPEILHTPLLSEPTLGSLSPACP